MKYFYLFMMNLIVVSVLSQTANIKGKIVDSISNDAVAFANVIIDGSTTGIISDIEGNFIISKLNPGYVRLKISCIGFKTKTTIEILLSNNNNTFIEIELDKNTEILNEVLVNAYPFIKTDKSILSMQSIGIKEIESNPGSNRDISRVIQSFPGVGSTTAYRNDLIIRGGGPSENIFFLDCVEIPVLNHFSKQGSSGGPVGIINADFLRSVDFYSSSFPAIKYNALSGILDFKLKDGNKDKTNYQFSLGASETAFTIDGPVGKKTSYIFSVRRSYLQFLFSTLGLPFLPTYNDFQFKLKTNINNKNTFTLISLGSFDNLKLNNNIKKLDEYKEYVITKIPINKQWSYVIGGVYKHFMKNGFHTFVLSRNMLNNRLYKYPDNDKSKMKTLDYISTEVENKFRHELTFIKHSIKYSFSSNMEYANYNNKTDQQKYINDSLIYINYSTGINVFKYGISGQISKRFFKNRLKASFGIRFDGNNYNKYTSNPLNQSSPRLSVSYTLTKETSLKGGAGRYFQQPAYTTMGFIKKNKLVNYISLKYIGLNQYNFGIEHRFKKYILLSLEGFYKDYLQYPIDLNTGVSLANKELASVIAGASHVNFTGKGRTLGFEILNRWNTNSFNLLASYTYVRSLFTDINNNYIASSWDSKHLFTITASKELKNNWRIGFKWRYVGGLPYTPYDLETSSKIEAWNANRQAYLDYSKLNSQRFSGFHQLDLRVDKNIFFKKWALMIYIDIQNVYNFKNIGQDYIVREKNTDGSYITINNGSKYVLKSISKKSGTVLPTIGLMIKF